MKVPTSSLRRNPTAGLTVKVIPRKGSPESEAVTAALVARSLRLLRDIDPVFDVDLYQTVGDALPDGAGVEQALASNLRQILVPPTEKSIEAALIERRRSPDATGGMYPLSLGRHMTLYSPAGDVKVVVSFGGAPQVRRIRMCLCRRITDFAGIEARTGTSRHLGLACHRALPPNRIIASVQRTG